MNIGQRIKERRKLLKMSADELGKRLGKDRSTIYRYEKGDIENLPLDILEPIASALGTTPQYLMGWEKVQQKNSTLAALTLRMHRDAEFLSIIEMIGQLNSEQLNHIKQSASLLLKLKD
jgi:transcriptional regulator with XRE-family HTH domain